MELTNAARLNPQAYADRYLGGDLNLGLADYNGQHGTSHALDAQAVLQPLAPNAQLHDAARVHSLWMLENDVFQHGGDPAYQGHPTYPGPSTYAGLSNAGERMAAAGYDFNGTWTWAENLAWLGNTGPIDPDAAITVHFESLFQSAGHRVNTLQPDLREIGVAQEMGQFTQGATTFNASMFTATFGATGTDSFITGVVYDDVDGDGFYSIGEGRGGVSLAARDRDTTTAAAGGYALAVLPASAVDVTLTGATGAITVTVDLSGGNAKLDLVDGSVVQASTDLKLGAGATDARLLGAADLSLTGNAGNNRLQGGQGNDTIDGGAGHDTVILTGSMSDYTMTQGQGQVTVSHHDTSAAGDGTDVLRNIEALVFSDTTVFLTPPPVAEQSVDAPLDAAPPPEVHLVGRVSLGHSETPVAGLSLQVLHSDGAVQDLTTAGDGSVSLPPVVQAAQLVAVPQDTAESGQITALDALNILRMSVGLDPTFGEADAFDFVAADVDGNGAVTAHDALDVLRHTVGLDAGDVGHIALIDEVAANPTRTQVAAERGVDLGTAPDPDDLDITAVRLGDLGIYE